MSRPWSTRTITSRLRLGSIGTSVGCRTETMAIVASCSVRFVRPLRYLVRLSRKVLVSPSKSLYLRLPRIRSNRKLPRVLVAKAGTYSLWSPSNWILLSREVSRIVCTIQTGSKARKSVSRQWHASSGAMGTGVGRGRGGTRRHDLLYAMG